MRVGKAARVTTCISCRRLMTLITDNLTKGNRKNIETALIGGQLNAMVYCS
jgi:hypothetical protein